jgi:hypothetical protein
MGEIKGKRRIIRLPEEEWDEDCIDKTFRGKTEGVMFYGIIGFNWKGPCHVYRKETKEQRKASLHVLEDPHAAELQAARAE